MSTPPVSPSSKALSLAIPTGGVSQVAETSPARSILTASSSGSEYSAPSIPMVKVSSSGYIPPSVSSLSTAVAPESIDDDRLTSAFAMLTRPPTPVDHLAGLSRSGSELVSSMADATTEEIRDAIRLLTLKLKERENPRLEFRFTPDQWGKAFKDLLAPHFQVSSKLTLKNVTVFSAPNLRDAQTAFIRYMLYGQQPLPKNTIAFLEKRRFTVVEQRRFSLGDSSTNASASLYPTLRLLQFLIQAFEPSLGVEANRECFVQLIMELYANDRFRKVLTDGEFRKFDYHKHGLPKTACPVVVNFTEVHEQRIEEILSLFKHLDTLRKRTPAPTEKTLCDLIRCQVESLLAVPGAMRSLSVLIRIAECAIIQSVEATAKSSESETESESCKLRKQLIFDILYPNNVSILGRDFNRDERKKFEQYMLAVKDVETQYMAANVIKTLKTMSGSQLSALVVNVYVNAGQATRLSGLLQEVVTQVKLKNTQMSALQFTSKPE